MAANALAARRADATEARIAGLSLPQGAPWATEARQAALARLTAMGLPQRRDEYWRYTDPTTLTATEAATSDPALRDEGPIFGAVEQLRIVFVDGVFDPDQSDPLQMAGLEIERLADVTAKDIHWAKDLLGVLEARGQKPVERSLAAFNTAFAADGVVIRAVGRAEKPVALIYLQDSDASDVMLHHLVKVEPGADVTVLETGPAAARFSKVMEVDIADGGAFHHVRAQGRAH